MIIFLNVLGAAILLPTAWFHGYKRGIKHDEANDTEYQSWFDKESRANRRPLPGPGK